MRSLAKFLLPLALSIPLGAQVRTPRSPARGGGNVGSVVDAVATFDGVFKTADKKFVEIQVESGDTMRMYLTHGTKFIRDGKPAKAADFHDGDKVTADASRDIRMNLLAVKIEKKPNSKDAQMP